MQIVMVGENTCGLARLYRGRTLIGLCHDTPNAIASAMKHSGATRAVDVFGEPVEVSPAGLAAGGWMPVAQSGWSPL